MSLMPGFIPLNHSASVALEVGPLAMVTVKLHSCVAGRTKVSVVGKWFGVNLLVNFSQYFWQGDPRYNVFPRWNKQSSKFIDGKQCSGDRKGYKPIIPFNRIINKIHVHSFLVNVDLGLADVSASVRPL